MTGQLDTAVRPIPRPAIARRRHLTRGVAAAVVVLIAVSMGLMVPGWRHGGSVSAQPAPPPAAVTVSAPLQRNVAGWTGFLGQFSAVDQVEIRAQVGGYLTEIHFTDGQIVHKGDLLFVIDPRPYSIALAQGNAQLMTASAGLDLARQELARAAQLKHDSFVSGEVLDQRVQQERGAEAALEQAKAAVGAAALNMEFTHVTAPIDGRISSHRVSIGNLVSGGQGGMATTLLTTIVSLDPIHLDFDMSETDYLAYRRFLQSMPAGSTADHAVDASLADEQGWTRHGTLDFIDNAMDRGSGTIHARATLANPGLFIAPGQFARLRLPTAAPTPTLLVPDEAVTTDQSQKQVLTVAADGTVVPRPVELGPMAIGLRVVRSGLHPGDRVIINGMMHAFPGTRVAPQQGHIVASSDG